MNPKRDNEKLIAEHQRSQFYSNQNYLMAAMQTLWAPVDPIEIHPEKFTLHIVRALKMSSAGRNASCHMNGVIHPTSGRSPTASHIGWRQTGRFENSRLMMGCAAAQDAVVAVA